METTKQISLSQDDELIIKNISNCINDKMSLLNIKLTKLAEEASIDYFTLRKIVTMESGYMPNLRVLVKLAAYLNIKVGDLLNYNDLPQYIPIISKSEIEEFLKNRTKIYGFKNKVFNEKYIHEQAFAIKELYKELIIPAEIIYICYPNNNKILVKDQVYLFKLENNIGNENIVFGRVISINDDSIKISVGQEHVKIKNYNIVAIIVSMQMSEIFI